MRQNEPFIVEVTRGTLVESRHRIHAVVIDAAGQIVEAWGAIEAPVYPRSAIKPIQALPLLMTGAFEAYGLDDDALALACASHGGTEAHVSVARAVMARTGARLGDLGCGAHPPMDAEAAGALIERHEPASALHNNCSGKHLGMIATARHCGEPTLGYLAVDHPVQRRIHAALEVLTGESLKDWPIGIDGCSAPTFALPLRALARAFARHGAPDGLGPDYAEACKRVARAMTASPLMVGGPARLTTDVMAAGGGDIVLKEGAEGVYVASLPRLGLGLALKAEDGAVRAAEVAALALLRRHGGLRPEVERKLEARFEPVLHNWRGTVIGRVAPALS